MRKGFLREVKRQSVHALGSLTVPFILLVGYDLSKILIIIFIAVLISSSLYRKNKKYFRKLFFFKPLNELENYIEQEICKFERSREFPLKGAITFYIGVLLVVCLFPIEIAIPAILVLSFGDSVSTIIGKTFGKYKIPYNKNSTIEGSFSFFIVSSIVLYFFSQHFLLIAFIVALVEALPKLDDNITIPLATAVLLSLL